MRKAIASVDYSHDQETGIVTATVTFDDSTIKVGTHLVGQADTPPMAFEAAKADALSN